MGGIYYGSQLVRNAEELGGTRVTTGDITGRSKGGGGLDLGVTELVAGLDGVGVRKR